MDAREYYAIDEPAVFEKALALYQKAMELDPENFVLASEYAHSFYGMIPMSNVDPQVRRDTTLKIAARAIPAWNNTLHLAKDNLEREGVLIHLARTKLLAEQYDEALRDLDSVTNRIYETIKARIRQNILEKRDGSGSTSIPTDDIATNDLPQFKAQRDTAP
jgi:hypothetical protein